jgi:hypothetical protein
MFIRRFVCLSLIVAATALASHAQRPPDTRDEQLAAMKRLSSMVGSWSGTGWMQTGPNERRESNVTESIQSKLDGIILVVDGLGKNSAGQIVHQAFGVFSYDPGQKIYKFATYLKDGKSTVADAHFEGENFVWGFDTPNGTIRYTITFTASDWTEVGERSADKKTWHKFFEMKLKKE